MLLPSDITDFAINGENTANDAEARGEAAGLSPGGRRWKPVRLKVVVLDGGAPLASLSVPFSKDVCGVRQMALFVERSLSARITAATTTNVAPTATQIIKTNPESPPIVLRGVRR